MRYREIKFRLEVLEHPYRALLEVSNHSELPETRSSCGKVTGKYPDSHFLNEVFSLYKQPTMDCIYKQLSVLKAFVIRNNEKFYLRYFNFQPSFKVRCCHARVFYRSQIPLSTGGSEQQTSLIQCGYLAH